MISVYLVINFEQVLMHYDIYCSFYIINVQLVNKYNNNKLFFISKIKCFFTREKQKIKFVLQSINPNKIWLRATKIF